jgi:acetyl-CoA acetyltransferase family protein
MNKDTFIIDGLRSPIGLKNGNLVGMRPDDLATNIVKGLLDRNSSINHKNIEDIVIGCAFPEGSQGMLMARGISIMSGIPKEAGAKVVNRLCGSSMDAAHQISQAIDSEDIDCGIAGGTEDMFGVPMGGYMPSFNPILFEEEYYIGMGETAENLARELNISREDQENFSIASHSKALKAISDGKFDNEIHPIEFNENTVNQDEGPRTPDIDKMKSLDPAFDAEGTVTAATSSPISTGASAILLGSGKFVKDNNLKTKYKILSRAVAGVDWKTMGAGPLPATEKALKKSGMNMSDIDVIELNEAFAAQSLYVIRKGEWNEEKINLNGGAIALGHPLGCSGTRIIITLMNVMEQNNLSTGLATMCIGTGQGIATIIERI